MVILFSTDLFFYNIIYYLDGGEFMKVKLFDFEHEQDLEKEINKFLTEKKVEVKDIQYQTSHFCFNGEQIYSFSCMILYK